MPFPVDKIYIEETEKELDVIFPPNFKTKMEKENGGEIEVQGEYFDLHPFFDKSDKKRINRTCNHIALETKNAKEWDNFPSNGIAIASDGCGNLLLLIHNGDKKLQDTIHFWDHETGEITPVANSI